MSAAEDDFGDDDAPDSERWAAVPDSALENDEQEPPLEERTEPHTDLANSERLVDRYGADLRYVAKWKTWMVFDGRRWRKTDGTGAVTRLAKRVAREMFAEAKNLAVAAAAALADAKGTDREDRAKEELKRAMSIVGWARATQSKNRIDAMIALAQSADGVAVEHDAFDANPNLLNVANGTLDTKTFELRPHRRDDLITKLTPVVLDATAKARAWEAFLLVVVPDAEVRLLLQRFAGCCLTGDTSDRVFVFLFGSGRNGKSVFLRVLRTLLGEYGIVAAPDLLLKKKGEPHPTDIADLHGARLVVCQEVPKNRAFDEQRVKELTGNEGSIKARRMGENFWDFRPELKLAIAGNHEPRVHDDTDAIWDRMRRIPFTTRITDEQLDKHLFEKLEAELTGILAWAVQGCADWREHGLPSPKAVADATDAYRSSEDAVGRFLTDCCVIHKDRKATVRQLADAARAWAALNGERDIAPKDLADRLRRDGCQSAYVNRARGWHGIGLLDEQETTSRNTEKEGTSLEPATRATPCNTVSPLFASEENSLSRKEEGGNSRCSVLQVLQPAADDDGEPYLEPDDEHEFSDLLRGDS